MRINHARSRSVELLLLTAERCYSRTRPRTVVSPSPHAFTGSARAAVPASTGIVISGDMTETALVSAQIIRTAVGFVVKNSAGPTAASTRSRQPNAGSRRQSGRRKSQFATLPRAGWRGGASGR